MTRLLHSHALKLCVGASGEEEALSAVTDAPAALPEVPP